MMIFRLLASIALFSCCSFAPVDAKLKAPSHFMEAPEDNQLPKASVKYEMMELAELYIDHFGISSCDFFTGIGCTVDAVPIPEELALCPVTAGATCAAAVAETVVFLSSCRDCIGDTAASVMCSAAYLAVKTIRLVDSDFNDSALKKACKGLDPHEKL